MTFWCKKSVANIVEVTGHLKKLGLIVKPPESLGGGTVLGLRLKKDSIGKFDIQKRKCGPQGKQ